MKSGPARRTVILIGVAAMVTAALSVTVTAATSTPQPDRIPDTTTVGRLSGGPISAETDRVQVAASISDTAWLASGLLSAIEFEVNLPLIER